MADPIRTTTIISADNIDAGYIRTTTLEVTGQLILHGGLDLGSGSVVLQGTEFSGSHTTLGDGTSYLVAGANITIVSASNGQITISSTATGTGTGDNAPTYLTLTPTGSLTNERQLTVSGSSTGLKITDFGPGSTLSLSINDGVVATVSGTIFTGPVTASLGIAIPSGSTAVISNLSASVLNGLTLSGSLSGSTGYGLFLSSSGVARMRKATLNVLDFGADPTGVNDSLPAFRLALSAAHQNDQIDIPLGTYLFSDTFEIRDDTISTSIRGITFKGYAGTARSNAGTRTIIRANWTDPMGGSA